MGLRICKCGKREMVRGKNPNPLCGKCRMSNTSRRRMQRRKDNGECIRCKAKVSDNKVTCKKCRDKTNNKRKTTIVQEASLEGEE